MRLTLKAILIGSVGFLGTVALGQSVMSIIKLSQIETNMKDVAGNWLPSTNVIQETSTATRDLRVRMYRFVVASDTPEAFIENQKLLKASAQNLDALRKVYEPLISEPAERDLYGQFSSAWKEYETGLQQIDALMVAGKIGRAHV